MKKLAKFENWFYELIEHNGHEEQVSFFLKKFTKSQNLETLFTIENKNESYSCKQ